VRASPRYLGTTDDKVVAAALATIYQ